MAGTAGGDQGGGVGTAGPADRPQFPGRRSSISADPAGPSRTPGPPHRSAEDDEEPERAMEDLDAVVSFHNNYECQPEVLAMASESTSMRPHRSSRASASHRSARCSSTEAPSA
jgi:hypothetical protein